MSKNFLIGQLARFGDCLFATTLAKQIRHDFPDSRITWAIASKYRSILDLNPDVDEVWEIDATDADYDNSGWEKFEAEALAREKSGEFDKVFFSQISPKNWIKFNGTIRGTILASYENPITVPAIPVINLSPSELANVARFAEKHNLNNFEHVILFECSPGSQQSKVTFEFALEVAQKVAKSNKNSIFILSSRNKTEFTDPQIIDASNLTFRENAALTHFGSMMIGCSSGISWLATSTAAKTLPMIQLLDERFYVYAGMDHDFEINGFDNSQIIELTDFDAVRAAKCIESLIEFGPKITKQKYHQVYKPNYFNLRNLTNGLIAGKHDSASIIRFIRNFAGTNKKNGNGISRKYLFLIPYTHLYGFLYRNVIATESGLFFYLRRSIKSILWKKSL